MGHLDEGEEFGIGRTELKDMADAYEASRLLANVLGLSLRDQNVLEVEKLVVEHDIEQYVWKGKVEAYENLLLGRGVTVTS